jgi:hypothetical protein
VITTTAAAGAALVLLLVLVATTSGRSGLAAAAEPDRKPTAEEREQIRAFQDGQAELARIASVAQAVAPPTTAAPTTTTTAPPPAPTTTAPPPPPPAPQPVATGSGYNDPSNPAAWDRLAQCESGGNWAANTGNGYYGGIQFSLSSWQGVGGTGRPDQASRATQIAMGQRLWHQGGWVHWPACSSKLGYR